jgi:hypothetical protein
MQNRKWLVENYFYAFQTLDNTDTNTVLIWCREAAASRNLESYDLVGGYLNFMVFAGIMCLTSVKIMITIRQPTLWM